MHKFEESKGQAFLTIKQVALTDLLDYVEDNRQVDNYSAKQIGKVKVFDLGASAKDIQKLHLDSQQEVYLAFR